MNPTKKIAISQSNYIPWKGYFDMIAAADEFILHDSARFTKQDWRNRNKIKTARGVAWMTVPVGLQTGRLVREVTLPNASWQAEHWNLLKNHYRRARHYKEIAAWLEPLYLGHAYTHLSELNRRFIEAICQYLGITTPISNSWDYTLIEGKTERLVSLCLQAGATEYISGPKARAYLVEGSFAQRNIGVAWFEYSGYREYPQLHGGFVHEVSIVDLLFNCGPESASYMRYVRP